MQQGLSGKFQAQVYRRSWWGSERWVDIGPRLMYQDSAHRFITRDQETHIGWRVVEEIND